MKSYLCETAWTGQGFESDVLVETEDGAVSSVEAGADPEGAERLAGVTFPGFVNTHSHVFHRLLRGYVGTKRRGDFWSWREAMYEVAEGLDPDSYREVAAATYREMVLAGYTSVTEFHYLHHQPGGTPYDDPNVMADALADAAAEAGVRLTLLDTCYLSGGFGFPPEGAQLRFSDGSSDAWLERVSAWKPPDGVSVGAAIHSVRAVNPRQMEEVADWAGERELHVHLSEQPDENRDSLNHYGRSPTRVLEDAGVLSGNTTVVHATHVADTDIAVLARTGVTASICPTTERWLADGIGPTGKLAKAGVPLRIGSDSQAVIDPFEEMRLLELHQRLATGRTGVHSVASMLAAGTAGRALEAGTPADLVTISPNSPRTAGVPVEGILYAATSADVAHVMVGGSPAV